MIVGGVNDDWPVPQMEAMAEEEPPMPQEEER